MRFLTDDQGRLVFFQPTLKETRVVYERYEEISNLLDRSPKIVRAVRRDLEMDQGKASKPGRCCKFNADSVLRVLLVKAIEGLSLRDATVRVDDSTFLRRFTRLHEGPVMSYATLDRLKNTIRPKTWQKINRILIEAAVSGEHEDVSGSELRIDTTAVETNIHHPTDSSLLWDGYRVLANLIDETREIAPELVAKLRLHRRRVKREAHKISRLGGKKNARERMKVVYERILREVRRIQGRARDLVSTIRSILAKPRYVTQELYLRGVVDDLEHYLPLVENVLDQATRRVIGGESVPNDEKIFSLFEPHTELLKRGKSWRAIEYGHMVQIEQVRSKLITGYEVFPKKPNEPDLLLSTVKKHKSLFGGYPELVTTDKGYSEKERVAEIQALGIRTSIGRKGRSRDAETRDYENSQSFRLAQAFRAGIEGTIAFLKSSLGLRRCLDKGWNHFAAAIGLSVLAHNLTLGLLIGGRLLASEPQVGFPIYFPTGVRHPSIADVDGDGLPEILAGSFGSGIHIYRGDGTPLPGWPFPANGAVNVPPLVGDIDGDGEQDVVFHLTGNPQRIHAVSASGIAKPGWPVIVTPIGMTDWLNLGDLNDDGAVEILVSDYDYAVHSPVIYAYQGNGEPVPGWPVYLPTDGGVSGLAIGDLEFDGLNDVVVSTAIYDGGWQPSPVFVLNGDGTIRNGWPVLPPAHPGYRVLFHPVIADLDGDLSCEIIGGYETSLYVLNSDGSSFHYPYSTFGYTRPAACVNLDDHPNLEIIAPGVSLKVIDIIYGYVAETDPTTYRFFDGLSVGDVDGDGDAEIAVWSKFFGDDGLRALHLYNKDLEELPGWPKTWPWESQGFIWGTAMADLDGDNDLEIVNSTITELHAWDQPNPSGNPVHVEWSMLGHDSLNSHFYHTGAIPVPVFIRGDASRDGKLDVADPIRVLMVLLDLADSTCPAELDFNGDDAIDLGDVIGLLTHLYAGGPPPDLEPFPGCGPAPEGLELPCFVADCP